MYQKIKALADEAIALQNKTRMDVVLREISALCNPELHRQSADAELLKSEPTGFGLARLKMEGCALHPDNIDADMTPEQEARQLAAYERDVAVIGDGYERKTYPTSTFPDGDPPEVTRALKSSMKVVKKGAKK